MKKIGLVGGTGLHETGFHSCRNRGSDSGKRRLGTDSSGGRRKIRVLCFVIVNWKKVNIKQRCSYH